MFSLDSEAIRTQGLYRDPLFVHGVGAATFVLGALCAVLGVRKLFDKRPGLVLDGSGITDNSSAVSAGFIPWSEIEGAEIFEIHRQKTLIIKLKNPEAYLERGNPIKRAINKMGFKMSGSPIALTSSTLKIGFPELLALVERYHQKFGQA